MEAFVLKGIDRNSDFFPEVHDVRREGAYITEECCCITLGLIMICFMLCGRFRRNEDKKEIRSCRTSHPGLTASVS